jgi:hypothetical protein
MESRPTSLMVVPSGPPTVSIFTTTWAKEARNGPLKKCRNDLQADRNARIFSANAEQFPGYLLKLTGAAIFSAFEAVLVDSQSEDFRFQRLAWDSKPGRCS